MRKEWILFVAVLFGAHQSNSNAIQFSDECKDGENLVIGAVGDLLLHSPLQLKASKTGYESLWAKITDFLHPLDLSYANLEGPIAPGIGTHGKTLANDSEWNFEVYTGYPLFNYHRSLARALKTSGFDIVSTANNHALDRSSIGIDKTIEALTDAEMKFSGTRKKGSSTSFVTLTSSNEFDIAWIACSEHINGNKDKYGQVLNCYQSKDRALIIETITEIRSKVDAIIITPHFGDEYQRQNNKAQELFALQVLEAGAIAVIGSHPHVLQPVKKHLTKDGRETLIAYSLGNFVSYQGSLEKRSSILLMIRLTKDKLKNTTISGMRYVPLFMSNQGGVDNIEVKPLTSDETSGEAFRSIIKSVPKENAVFRSPVDWGCDL